MLREEKCETEMRWLRSTGIICVDQIFVSTQDLNILTKDLVLKNFSCWKTGNLISPLNVHFNVWKYIITNLVLSSFFPLCF